MSNLNDDFDLLDEEEDEQEFGQDFGQTDKADEPTNDKAEGDPTDTEDKSTKDGDDPVIRLAELEFENEQMKAEVKDLAHAAEFLDGLASDPVNAIRALAQQFNVPLEGGNIERQSGQSGTFKWKDADTNGVRYQSDDEIIQDVQSFVSSHIGRLEQRLANLERETGEIKPVIQGQRESREAQEKASAAEKRAGGVSGLVVMNAPKEFNGWTPTKEQIQASARNHPELFLQAKSAKEVADACNEALWKDYRKDILSHKTGGSTRQDGSRPPVPKNDARGSTDAYAARKARIAAATQNRI